MTDRGGVNGRDRILGFDGIRALAVSLVFVSHLWLAVPELMSHSYYKVFTKGGFLGVNVFFVLSGFLITFRLASTTLSGVRGILRGYYASRFMRILPLALLFLVLHYGYVHVFEYPPEAGASEELTGIISTIFQYSNYAILDNPSVLRDNVAIWSLSIEGQFYATAPLLVIPIAIAARKSRWSVAALCAVFIALTVHAARVYDTSGWFDVYLRTDTRISSLLLGVFGAFVWLNFNNAVPRLLSVLSVLALVVQGLVVSKARADGSFIWNGGMALFDVASLVLVLSLAYRCCPIVRVLELKPLKWLGEISYGLYLWQLPVVWTVNRHAMTLDWRLRLLLVPLVIVSLSVLSLRYFERPLIKGAFARRLRGSSETPSTSPQPKVA